MSKIKGDVSNLGVLNAPAEQFDVRGEKSITRQADAALAFLRQDEGEANVAVDDKALLRKIDFLVMPMMLGAYTFQYLDKSLVNYANVMGLTKDTGMTAAEYSYLATFFYITFLVFQPIHGVLIQRFPVARYLGVMVTLWGVCVTMHCACKSFAGLAVVRLLLGAFEAAVAPCLVIITGMWYKRTEQPLRIAIWYLGVGLGTMVGALASYGFQFYVGKTFYSWQIMYLVFGILTAVQGILIFLFLPNSPMTSHLTHAEKMVAIERIRDNQTGIENRTFKKEQMIETLASPGTWLIVLIIIAGNIPVGATGTYSSTLIKGFGYTSKQSALLNVPSGFIQCCVVLLAAWYAGRWNGRGIAIIALETLGILGGALIAFLPAGNAYKAGKIFGIYMTASIGPNLAIMYSWAAANYAGHTKKVTINAIVLMAYGISNIIAPLTFTGYTAPNYLPAKIAIVASCGLAVVLTLVLLSIYARENKRRDRSTTGEHVQDVEFMDLTDQQNKEFRYAY